MSLIKENGKLEDVDEAKGIVTGYFSTFDILDSDGDIIRKGAYEKTIQERGMQGSNRIKHVIDHMGSVKGLLGIPKLNEDEKGLRFETKISKTTLGRDVLQLYIDEVITEHSVRIEIDEAVENQAGAQELTELTLWEGSSVVWGANAETPTESVKGIENMIEHIRKVNKNGDYTDETHKWMEQYIEQLKQLRDEADKALKSMKQESSLQIDVSGISKGANDLLNKIDNF